MRRPVLATALAVGILILPWGARPVTPGAYYSKDEALALAFPDADAIHPKSAFLTEAQAAAVAKRTGTKPESLLFSYYVGERDGQVVGYAVIDTHIVRTLPETFLAVLTPEGTVKQLILLAFYEPPEYQPSERWLAQFQGRALTGAGWRLGHDIHGISGATLTARAIPEALQKVLLLYELVMAPAAPAAKAP